MGMQPGIPYNLRKDSTVDRLTLLSLDRWLTTEPDWYDEDTHPDDWAFDDEDDDIDPEDWAMIDDDPDPDQFREFPTRPAGGE